MDGGIRSEVGLVEIVDKNWISLFISITCIVSNFAIWVKIYWLSLSVKVRDKTKTEMINMINIMKIITMENKGFSLVELMVAVGIIGSMSAVAVPNYAKFKAKSLQATAQQNLSNIYTLQNLYFTEHDEYGKATDIEFSANDSKYKYNIGITSTPATAIPAVAGGTDPTHVTSGDTIGFKATAKSDGKLAACSTKPDNWCVNQAKMLTNDPDDTDGIPIEKTKPCAQEEQGDDSPTSIQDFSNGSC